MNYNELEFLNEEYELIRNEMLEALANDEIGHFNYLRSNSYTSRLLDLIAKDIQACNEEEFIESIQEVVSSLNLVK